MDKRLPRADNPRQSASAGNETLMAELQASRDREAVLRGELQHRVRNTLAIVRSIFSRTVEAGGSLEHVADHFRGRLEAIARHQFFPSAEPHATTDFEQLVRDELFAFRFGDDDRIEVEGPETRLALDAARLLGLAVHELVTNSLKFGALSIESGRARIAATWSVSKRGLRFEWSESGVPALVAKPARRGFGREFIEQALPYQLDATTLFELRPGGLFCEIEFPLISSNENKPISRI